VNEKTVGDDQPGIILNESAVQKIIEDALRDRAWWIAARAGMYVHGGLIWADCIRNQPVAALRLFGARDSETRLPGGGDR